MKLLEPYNCRRFLKDCGNLFFYNGFSFIFGSTGKFVEAGLFS